MESLDRMYLARKSLEHVAAQLDELEGTDGPWDVAKAREALASALDATAEFVGECKKRTPYAPMWMSREGDQLVWKCAHDPSHVSEVNG